MTDRTAQEEKGRKENRKKNMDVKFAPKNKSMQEKF
jgi:hypothetical protein